VVLHALTKLKNASTNDQAVRLVMLSHAKACELGMRKHASYMRVRYAKAFELSMRKNARAQARPLTSLTAKVNKEHKLNNERILETSHLQR
jgi:hypothetical protein